MLFLKEPNETETTEGAASCKEDFISCSHNVNDKDSINTENDDDDGDDIIDSIDAEREENYRYAPKPPLPNPSQPHTIRNTSILKPGALFTGYQESGRRRYEVEVKLAEVNLNDSTMSGFLTIHNLTEAYPLITTFFKSEIVGRHYSFETNHESWGSSLRNDTQHWARFTPWRNLDIDIPHNAEKAEKYYDNAINSEYLFMRWKEIFLYPDAHVTGIRGASFAGFYYVCFNQLTGSIVGLYYHKSSDKFQQLNLSFVPDSGVRSIYEYA